MWRIVCDNCEIISLLSARPQFSDKTSMFDDSLYALYTVVENIHTYILYNIKVLFKVKKAGVLRNLEILPML